MFSIALLYSGVLCRFEYFVFVYILWLNFRSFAAAKRRAWRSKLLLAM